MKRTVVVIESQSRDKASLSLARQLLKRVACCINSRCCASLAAHCPGSTRSRGQRQSWACMEKQLIMTPPARDRAPPRSCKPFKCGRDARHARPTPKNTTGRTKTHGSPGERPLEFRSAPLARRARSSIRRDRSISEKQSPGRRLGGRRIPASPLFLSRAGGRSDGLRRRGASLMDWACWNVLSVVVALSGLASRVQNTRLT